MSILDTAIVKGRAFKGTPYRFCTFGARTPLPTDPVLGKGMCCTEYLDVMRRAAGRRQIGGTPAWGQLLDSNADYIEDFDPKRWYTVGSIPFQYWQGPSHEGHIGIISRPNQLMLDCSFTYGVSERLPNFTYQGGFQVVGTMEDLPGAEGLPWKSPWDSLSVAGYPGHCASPVATARWMARVAAVIYGLPAILPVMTSCVELTGGWQGPGCVTDVPGYGRAVDYDSLGWFQQRPAAGWGTPQQITNAEYALSKFLDAAIREAPHWPTRNNYTADQLGDWAARVQNPFAAYRDRYRDIGFPMARKLLDGTIWEGHKIAGGDAPIKVPSLTPRRAPATEKVEVEKEDQVTSGEPKKKPCKGCGKVYTEPLREEDHRKAEEMRRREAESSGVVTLGETTSPEQWKETRRGAQDPRIDVRQTDKNPQQEVGYQSEEWDQYAQRQVEDAQRQMEKAHKSRDARRQEIKEARREAKRQIKEALREVAGIRAQFEEEQPKAKNEARQPKASKGGKVKKSIKRAKGDIDPKVAAGGATALIVAGLLAMLEQLTGVAAPDGVDEYLVALASFVAAYLKKGNVPVETPEDV